LSEAALMQWATPRASDTRSGEVSDEVYDRNSRPLTEQAARWATPTASCATDGNTERGGDRQGELLLAGQARAWLTPATADAIRSNSTRDRSEGPTLAESAARLFPTPSASQYGSSQNGINGKGGEFERPSAGSPSLETMARHGDLPSRQDRTTSPGGEGFLKPSRVLNPRFVEMLMGWPIDWTACGSAVTASSISRPPSLSPTCGAECSDNVDDV
jgi:hypothetical protein